VLKKITNFIGEVRLEMSKVNWPPRDELMSSTKIVIFISLVFAVYIFIVDTGLSQLMSVILRD
jgi:preprotein translocase subunit SecE